ncbi:hypothetical protein ACVWXL_006612 [Bradyrhizobium sp. GM22.5]
MSAALLIDILLWGSVFGVGLIAFRRGPPVFKASLREGSMDFINIVPRIALGVIGSGYIAAIIPQEVISGWLGPDSRLARGRDCRGRRGRDARWPGDRVLDRDGGPEIGWWGAAGGRLCRRLGAICLPTGDFVGNSVHAGPFRLVPLRGFGAVPVRRRRHRHADRQTLSPAWTAVML